MRVRISRGSTVALIEPQGAYVAGVSLGGVPAIKPTGDGAQTHGGAAVLMPYAGRVRGGKYTFEGGRFALPVGKEGHAIHGFAKDALWAVARKAADSVVLTSRLEGRGYPGALEARIEYSVGTKSFSTDCSVRNAGKSDCPLVVGFHPYLLAKDWKISGGRSWRYSLRDGYFPTGKRAPFSFKEVGPESELDDCFRVNGVLELLTGDRRLAIRRRAMPYLVVYNGRYAERSSVAVEPYTGLPDAYNNGIGLIRLKPGRRFHCGYDIVVTGA